MAIPFFEPRPSEVTPLGDQVDGHGSPPSSTTPLSTAATTIADADLQSVPPTANEQALAWKILAVAMCKALKEYYLQSGSATEAFTSGNGSLVQVLPNGQVQPMWK